MNLDDDRAVLRQQLGLGVDGQQRLAPQFLVLGRRHVDEIEGFAVVALQKREAVPLRDHALCGEAAVTEVRLDRLHGAAVQVEELDEGRAAAQRLDAHCARAAE